MENLQLRCQKLINSLSFKYCIASAGMVQKDNEVLDVILHEFPQIPAICLDVANGYSEHFVEFVKDVRARHPEHIIMV